MVKILGPQIIAGSVEFPNKTAKVTVGGYFRGELDRNQTVTIEGADALDGKWQHDRSWTGDINAVTLHLRRPDAVDRA